MSHRRPTLNDAEALEEEAAQSPRKRTRFVELQPAADDPGKTSGRLPLPSGLSSCCGPPSSTVSQRRSTIYGPLHAADGIDEEVPGSVRADVEPLVLGDRPFEPCPPGGE